MGREITRASARSDRMRLSSDVAKEKETETERQREIEIEKARVRWMKREEIDTGTRDWLRRARTRYDERRTGRRKQEKRIVSMCAR